VRWNNNLGGVVKDIEELEAVLRAVRPAENPALKKRIMNHCWAVMLCKRTDGDRTQTPASRYRNTPGNQGEVK
jgi:hypothetical protein